MSSEVVVYTGVSGGPAMKRRPKEMRSSVQSTLKPCQLGVETIDACLLRAYGDGVNAHENVVGTNVSVRVSVRVGMLMCRCRYLPG